MDILRPGDTLVCTRVDRLAGSLKGLKDLVYELRNKGAHLKTIDQPIDTSLPGGADFFAILNVLAECDANAEQLPQR
jgi:DNA invertase Pin-like site-specific DNA recombinase